MSISTFRLPVGVKCLSNNGKVIVSGPCGTVAFGSVSKFYQRDNLIVFLPDLTRHETSIFTQAVQGVTLGYTVTLNLKGIGYKAQQEQEKLYFFVGYSVPVTFEVPKEISVKIDKRSITLMSANFGKLQNFLTTIRSCRFPDSYKGAGILYSGEKIICKEGKKT